MANTIKNAVLSAMIEGIIYDLMVQTNAENVIVEGNVTLAAKLAEMIVALNAKATKSDVDTAVSTAIGNLINGAPQTYDTLKEIADYIASNQNVVSALDAAIGNKADKSTVQAIQATVNGLGELAKKNIVAETDLDAALKEKVNAAAQGNHSHNNKAVLDGIDQAKVESWDRKSKVYYDAVKPGSLTKNDLWVRLV